MRSCCDTEPGSSHDKRCPNWRLAPPKRTCCNTNAAQPHRPTCDANYTPDPPPTVDASQILRHIRTLERITAADAAAAHQFAATTNWHLDRTDGQPAASRTDGSKGTTGIGDPVGRQMENRLEAWDTWQAVQVHLLEAVRNLDAAQQKMRRIERLDTANEAARHRCTGGMGQMGGDRWGDPTCRRLGITDDGLCDACRQRQEHWRRDPDNYRPRRRYDRVTDHR